VECRQSLRLLQAGQGSWSFVCLRLWPLAFYVDPETKASDILSYIWLYMQRGIEGLGRERVRVSAEVAFRKRLWLLQAGQG
jgi:hypothetical protein